MPNIRKFSILVLSFLFLSFASNAGMVLSYGISFAPAAIGPGSNSRLQFSFTNGTGVNVTGMTVTDTLPAGVMISSAANATSDCDEMIVVAPDGGSTITLSDGKLAVGASCTASVNVTSSSIGVHTNITGSLTSSAGSSGNASADLTVVNTFPGFSKNFAPSTINIGSPSTLTFTMDNSLNPNRVGNLDFTDTLPLGITIASPANATTDCISMGIPNTTLTAISGTDQIILDANGLTFAAGFEVLPVGAICTVSVDVIATGVGTLINQSANLLTDFVASGFAVATLDVSANTVIFSKEFIDDPVAPGAAVGLRFTLLNTDRNFSASALAFTDDLSTLVPALAGLTFTGLINNDCGGTLTGVGTTAIGLTGGVLAAAGSCSINVSLTVPVATSPGAFVNTSSSLTGVQNGSMITSDPAVANLFVQPSPILTKTFTNNPVGAGSDAMLEFTISNTSLTSSATNIDFSDVLTSFLPFPVIAVLPPNPCGMGSVLALSVPSNDVHRLELTGGSLAPAGMVGDSCTFTISITLPTDLPNGTYTNVTGSIEATIDGVIYTGEPAADDLIVVAPPQLSKEFTDDPVQSGASVNLQFTLSHDEFAVADATNIVFSDDLSVTLPGLTATGLPLANVCGAGSMLSGTTNLIFTGGTLQPGQSCSFNVTLSVPAAALSGQFTNTTSSVTADVSGISTVGNAASDVLSIANITFSKEFIDDPVIPGAIATLRFNIDNSNNTQDISNVVFTDNLVSVIPGLTSTGALPTNPCGMGSALVGPSLLIFTGGNLLAGTSCSFDVMVQVPGVTITGDYSNVTSNMTATVSASPVILPPAIDTLIVSSDLLQLTKTFTDDPVAPGGTVTLEFTIDNLDPTNAATTIAFTDDLDAALTGLVATGLPATNVCGAGSNISGTNLIALTGANLAAGGSCTFSVTLQVPASTTSSLVTNTTSMVTGVINGLAVDGPAASDDLFIQLVSFNKSFDGPTTAAGTALLNYTIVNQDAAQPANDMSFSDDLNAVIAGLVATGLPVNNTCGVGSVVSGTSFVTFIGGNLPPSGMCSFDVPVLVPATAVAGSFLSVTSDLTSAGLQIADPASASLIIEPPPAFTKTFAPSSIGLNLTSILTFDIDNTASVLAATSISFTDNLPAGMVLDTLPVVANTCGGSLTAIGGNSVVSLTGGVIAATSGCNIQVRVMANASGTLVNTTADLTSSSGNSGTASDSLTVNPQPLFAKSFAANPILFGDTSTLVFTIDNSASSVIASNLAFNDTLPADMQVATPGNVATTCTGGTLMAVDASSSIAYSSGAVAAGASCTISVDISTIVSGDFTNLSGDLSSNLGNSGSATDSLRVNPQPVFSKLFNPDVIRLGDTSQLSFTIDNAASTVSATALSFTDVFPAGVVVQTPANASNTCTGGTFTATDGSASVNYTGGTVAAATSCVLTVDVTSSVLGAVTNTSGNLSSSSGNSGTAAADLLVTNTPILSKSFAINPSIVNQANTLTFNIDNMGNIVLVSALAFSDVMPLGFEVAAAANISNTCTGGTLVAVSGSDTISYTGGSVNANTICAITVDVIATVVGVFTNTTTVLSTNIGDGNSASDTITINPVPLFAKSFLTNPIGLGDASQLVFTIDNTASTATANNLDFSDNLPAGMVVATPANASTTCTGGTLTTVAASSVISYASGSVSAASTCTISVDVTTTASGVFNNVSGDLTSDLGNSGTATDSLTVDLPATFSKQFNPSVIQSGGVSQLSFTIDNTGSAVNATSLDFIDNFPVGLVVANPANISNTCIGGTFTAVSASSAVGYTGGTVNAASSCTLSVDVTSSVLGNVTNLTGNLTSSAGDSGTASADFTVINLPILTKVFVGGAVTAGDNVEMTFSLTNNATVEASNITFSDDLDAFIVGAIANNLPQNDVCGIGSALTGTSIISLTGGVLAANSSCQFSVFVTVPEDVVSGDYMNITSPINADYNGFTVMGDVSSSASGNLIVNGILVLIPLINNWVELMILTLMLLMTAWTLHRSKLR